MQVRIPTSELLPSYQAALARGWSPSNTRPEAATEELAKSQADPVAFIADMDDREARGEPVIMPDGTKLPRLPGIRRWAWDGEFCGTIGFRWQPGTEGLPPYTLGHIGYTVVPWKRGRGYAKAMLAAILPEAKAIGLSYVDLTTEADNAASQRVILANSGVFLREFEKPAQYGSGRGYLFRIAL